MATASADGDGVRVVSRDDRISPAQVERAAQDAQTRKVREMILQRKLPTVRADPDPSRVFVRANPVVGYDVVRRDLKVKAPPPFAREPPPEFRNVMPRDRMEEAAVAEKCHGVRRSGRRTPVACSTDAFSSSDGVPEHIPSGEKMLSRSA